MEFTIWFLTSSEKLLAIVVNCVTFNGHFQKVYRRFVQHAKSYFKEGFLYIASKVIWKTCEVGTAITKKFRVATGSTSELNNNVQC